MLASLIIVRFDLKEKVREVLMLADDLGAKSARQTVEIKVDQVEDSSITRVTSSPNEVRRVILHRKPQKTSEMGSPSFSKGHAHQLFPSTF